MEAISVLISYSSKESVIKHASTFLLCIMDDALDLRLVSLWNCSAKRLGHESIASFNEIVFNEIVLVPFATLILRVNGGLLLTEADFSAKCWTSFVVVSFELLETCQN